VIALLLRPLSQVLEESVLSDASRIWPVARTGRRAARHVLWTTPEGPSPVDGQPA